MTFKIATIALFIMLVVNGAKATSSDAERLAKMFSPILVLTEETSTEYDATEPIRVIKPEPVEIVGAGSASNIWIYGKDLEDRLTTNSGPHDAYRNSNGEYLSLEFFEHSDANCPNVNFSENKFAFLTSQCRRYLSGFAPVLLRLGGTYLTRLKDYPMCQFIAGYI